MKFTKFVLFLHNRWVQKGKQTAPPQFTFNNDDVMRSIRPNETMERSIQSIRPTLC